MFRRLREGCIGVLLFACGFLSVLITLAIMLSLFSEAIAFFQRPEVDFFRFLTGTTWRPTVTPVKAENFGILPLLNGTMVIAVISGFIAIPITRSQICPLTTWSGQSGNKRPGTCHLVSLSSSHIPYWRLRRT